MIRKIVIEDDIGSLIKSLRKDRDMTLEELSRRSGVSPSALSRFERNKRTPTLKSFDAVLSALDASLVIENK